MKLVAAALLLSLSTLTGMAVAQSTTTVLTNDTRLVYSGGDANPGALWGLPNADPTVYNDETCGDGTRATNKVGAWVTLIFTGSEVTVNFIGLRQGSTAQIVLDGAVVQEAVTNITDAGWLSCTSVSVSSGDLQEGSHNVTVIKDQVGETLFLRSIVYSSSSDAAAASASATDSAGNASSTNYPGLPADPSSDAVSFHVPTIGAIAVGVLFLAAGLGIFFFLRRRQRLRREAAGLAGRMPSSSSSSYMSRPTPFAPQDGGSWTRFDDESKVDVRVAAAAWSIQKPASGLVHDHDYELSPMPSPIPPPSPSNHYYSNPEQQRQQQLEPAPSFPVPQPFSHSGSVVQRSNSNAYSAYSQYAHTQSGGYAQSEFGVPSEGGIASPLSAAAADPFSPHPDPHHHLTRQLSSTPSRSTTAYPPEKCGGAAVPSHYNERFPRNDGLASDAGHPRDVYVVRNVEDEASGSQLQAVDPARSRDVDVDVDVDDDADAAGPAPPVYDSDPE